MRGGELVEVGEVRRVFRHPGHPYTAKLIESVPVIGGAVHRQMRAASAAAPPLIEFAGVGKIYARTPALHPISFALPGDSARILSVVGQSGSGKTTLGSLVLGFIPPTTGIIRWQGRPMTALSRRERRGFRRDVQAVFQDPYSTFNPFYRVVRSLTQPLRTFGLAHSAADARERAETACRQVGLIPALLDRFPHQLSGGQRQRMMVARALLLHPRLLVADEPVSMVDASLRAEILDLLVELRDVHEISIIYITHDLATAYRVSDEVLVLHKGRVVEAGAPEAVLGAPSHPYTRLLVDCLPWPDPERPWGARELSDFEETRERDEDHEAGALAGEGGGHLLG
jgi:ABC-type oligopeptide transport system ATPase subunit